MSWGPKVPHARVSAPSLLDPAVVGTKDPVLQLRSGGHMPRTGACDYSTRYMPLVRGHSHVQGTGVVGLEFPTLGMDLSWGGLRGAKGKSGCERVQTDVNVLFFSF